MTAFGAHLVQFYDRDVELVAGVADFLAEGLAAGEGCVLVATPVHQVAIVRALRAAGADPAPIVTADARDTLERIIDHGLIDPDRFDEAARHVLGKAAERAAVPRLRVFGEMVALLWDRGQIPLAMDLELRWNRAQRAHPLPFQLLCGYRMPAITEDPEAAAGFLDLCGCHSAVSRDGSAEPEAWRRFDDVRDLPGTRAFVRGTLGSWGCHALATEASLVVTELATNAVLHARTPFHVSVRRRREGRDVRITVHDGSESPPAVRHYAPGAPTGRGLHLIRALATGWGVDHFAGGKSVWAELSGGAG